MPVTASDLVLPTGRMPADWFLSSDIEGWLLLGYDTAPVEATVEQADAIATAYAYYRGYEAKADTLLGNPDNVGLGDMSVAQSNGRYDRMKAQAAEFMAAWLAAIDVVLNPPAPVEETSSRPRSVRLSFGWG
jgi:hypothetical protein